MLPSSRVWSLEGQPSTFTPTGALESFRASELALKSQNRQQESASGVILNVSSLSMEQKWMKVIFFSNGASKRVDGDVSLMDFEVKKSTWFDCLFTQQLLAGHSAAEIPVQCTEMTMTKLTVGTFRTASVVLNLCRLTAVSAVEPLVAHSPDTVPMVNSGLARIAV